MNRRLTNSHQINARAEKTIFPQKLWRMVNDEAFNSAIRWNRDGRSFMIFESQLKNMCLGKENNLFHTQQPKSFVRQLHLYGFRKISKNQFAHQFFRRGQPELLENIKRSYRQSISDDSKTIPANKSIKSENSTSNSDQQQQVSLNQPDQASTSSSSTNNFLNLSRFTNFHENLNSNQMMCHDYSSPLGALVFANHHDESSNVATPIDWYESSYIDISYNHIDDSILTLYNNEDNNIIL